MMTPCIAPAADDQDAYTFVDHREDPVAIIGYVARRLAPEHMLMARVDEDLEQIPIKRHRILRRRDSCGIRLL